MSESLTAANQSTSLISAPFRALLLRPCFLVIVSHRPSTTWRSRGIFESQNADSARHQTTSGCPRSASELPDKYTTNTLHTLSSTKNRSPTLSTRTRGFSSSLLARGNSNSTNFFPIACVAHHQKSEFSGVPLIDRTVSSVGIQGFKPQNKV